jgi:hypothetical protein
VRARTIKANQNRSHVDRVAVGCASIGIAMSRRARLMGASAIAGGTLRGLAVAAGMVTVFGGAPALAQCASTDTGFTGTCAATAATGANATAVGRAANAAGVFATA